MDGMVSVSEDAWLEAVEEHGMKVAPAREAGEVAGWLHTGNYALNYVISGRFNRGYPLGHAVEVFGDPSTGKSYLVSRAIAEAQRQGGAALLDDTEGAFNPTWNEQALGVDVDALGLHRSDTVKDHRDLCRVFLEAVQRRAAEDDEVVPYLLAVDSLALLATAEELEADFEAGQMHGARRAKLIRRLFREVGREMASLPTCYVATNHTIANIGSPFGPNRTTPGGSGPKFQASVRLDLRAPKKLKRDGEVRGVRIRAVVSKNRIAPPYREAVMAIPFYRSISPYSGLISLLVELGVLETSAGHTIVFKGDDTGIPAQKTNPLKQDKSAEEFFDSYPDLLDELDALLDEAEEAEAREALARYGKEEDE